MVKSKVIIEIISPNLRTRNMLEFVLQQQGKGRFEFSRGNRPDLVIVDFEKSDAKLAFRKYRSRFPKIPAILMLNQASEYDELPGEDRIGAEFLLLKPFASRNFISIINECISATPAIHSNTNSESAELSKVNELNKPVQTPAISDLHKSPKLTPRIDGKASSVEMISTLQEKAALIKAAALKPEKSTASEAEQTQKLQNSLADKIIQKDAPQHRWFPQGGEDASFSFALDSDIDMTSIAAVKNLWIKIDTKLLGYILRAIRQQVHAQSTISLSVNDGLCFYISPHNKIVVMVGENIDLVELAPQDLNSKHISVGAETMPKATSPQAKFGLEAFLWKLALYTYRGFLPEGVDVNKSVYLKYWPNLTRFEPTPNAMRIASLWCRQPVSLAFIIRMLNVPQRHVFNFYAAASTLDLAGPAIRDADSMLLPSFPGEINKNNSLVQRFSSKITSPDKKNSR